jgi:hypothetical protein
MRYCSTCLYPAPCGRCEDSDNSSARIVVPDLRDRDYCECCDGWVEGEGPWCDLYRNVEVRCIFEH